MGYIKEPEKVDLAINSSHLTAEDRVAISSFITKDKQSSVKKLVRNKASNLEKRVQPGK